MDNQNILIAKILHFADDISFLVDKTFVFMDHSFFWAL